MQFNFNCEQILNADSQGFAIIEAANINTLRPVYLQIVQQIIDVIGKASAKAQRGHLNYVATASFKFFKSGNERIYFKAKDDRVLGFIRIGPERHSLRDRKNNFSLKTTLVVKDFYVHESVQRKGIGKQLFDSACQKETMPPYQFAFDSANDVFLMFLEKNYGLTKYIVQNDSLLVFEEFFSSPLLKSNQSSGGLSMTSRDYSLDRNYSTEQKNDIYKKTTSEVNQLNSKTDFTSLSPSPYHNNSQKQWSSPNFHEKKYFANYYLNDLLASNNNQFLEQIYKRRTPLLNSTSSPSASCDIQQFHEQYVKEQLSTAIHGKEIINDRLKQLENSITPIQKKFTDYKKRNEFSTLLDLKSVRPKEPISFPNNYEQSFKINTPTSSGAYGYHYHQSNSYNIDGNSSQRNVFYNKQYN